MTPEQISRLQRLVKDESRLPLTVDDQEAVKALMDAYETRQESAIDDWIDKTFKFHSAGPTPQGFELRMKAGKIAKIFAVCFAELLKDRDVNNYVEMSVHHPEHGLINVIVLKPGGKSPHQLLNEAELERDQYKIEATKLNHMINQLFHKPANMIEGSLDHQSYVLEWYAKAKETLKTSFLNQKEPPNDQY